MRLDDKGKKYIIGNILIISGVLIIVLTTIVNIADVIRGNIALKKFDDQKSVWSVSINGADGIIVNNTVLNPESDHKTDELNNEKYTAEDNTDDADEVLPRMSEDKNEIPDVVGVLSIEKISLREAIKEGVERNVISSALGHMKDTPFPGECGNCVIAGHRNYVFGKYFNRLDEIETGDVIVIETMFDKYEYTVTEKFVVEPTDVYVTEPLDGKQLTLITCTPLFVGSHRLIVRAQLNDSDDI
ncbi:MAG: class D sortase [Lachnospiraceae bacterium]|nr:class D sortase [Lachnospiraceae bacterium]